MEIYISKNTLQNEMGILSNIIDKKGSIPILTHSFMKVEGGKLSFTATDLDLTIFSECTPEQIASPGMFCLPTKRIFDIVRVLPDGIVKLSGDTNGWLKIQAKTSNYKIPGADPGMFPELSKMPTDWMFVPGKLLRLALKGVSFAASTAEDNRFAIGGVRIQINETDMVLTATDGHRIAVSSVDLDDLMPSTMEAIIPAKAVGELSRLLASYDNAIGICLKENGIFFKVGERVLQSRLLLGQFPAIEVMFKQPYQYVAAFHANTLAQSLRRTIPVADDKLSAVTFDFNGNKVVLTSQDADKGECEEVLESNFNGGSLKIGLSSEFMLQYLDEVDTEPVRIDFADANTPVLLQTKKEGVTYKYILIPLRVKG